MLVTVVTVVKNNKNFISRTLQSILQQKYKNLELIVIDGKSEDGTFEIISKYFKEFKLISRKDKNVYDSLVVGVEDEKFGQKVIAVVSSDLPNLDADELINFARTHLSGYKLPKEVIFVDEVKRAPNGKANYKWAKEVADEYRKNL